MNLTFNSSTFNSEASLSFFISNIIASTSLEPITAVPVEVIATLFIDNEEEVHSTVLNVIDEGVTSVTYLSSHNSFIANLPAEVVEVVS